MISLVTNDQNKEANIFIDEAGLKMLQNLLEDYVGKTENDHDHIFSFDGLVSEDDFEGLDLSDVTFADEITIRFRPGLKRRSHQAKKAK